MRFVRCRQYINKFTTQCSDLSKTEFEGKKRKKFKNILWNAQKHVHLAKATKKATIFLCNFLHFGLHFIPFNNTQQIKYAVRVYREEAKRIRNVLSFRVRYANSKSKQNQPSQDSLLLWVFLIVVCALVRHHVVGTHVFSIENSIRENSCENVSHVIACACDSCECIFVLLFFSAFLDEIQLLNVTMDKHVNVFIGFRFLRKWTIFDRFSLFCCQFQLQRKWNLRWNLEWWSLS